MTELPIILGPAAARRETFRDAARLRVRAWSSSSPRRCFDRQPQAKRLLGEILRLTDSLQGFRNMGQMGLSALSLSLANPRSGKPKYYLYILRGFIFLGVVTSLTLMIMAFTRSLDLQNLALRLEGSRSGCPCPAFLTIMRSPDSQAKLMAEEQKTPSAAEYLRKRGVGLLHAWTDSELFLRAVEMEKAGTRTLASVPATNETTPRTPKIAFLFMIMDGIPFAPLWNKLFKGHEGLYNIYIHMWPLRPSAFPKSSGVFWGRVIPSQEGRRQTPGLIANARRLLANALLDDPDNEWFAVISESCVPIHGFRHIYNKMASTNNSFLAAIANHWDLQNRYNARGENVMQPEIQLSQFRMGSQFWVMRRRHAVITVRDTKYWNKFNRPCLPQYRYCYPEEHYFPTIFNILDPNGLSATVTLVDWSIQDPPGHPRLFNPSEIGVDFMRNLQQKADGQYLFARKFHSACLDPLLEIANTTFLEQPALIG